MLILAVLPNRKIIFLNKKRGDLLCHLPLKRSHLIISTQVSVSSTLGKRLKCIISFNERCNYTKTFYRTTHCIQSIQLVIQTFIKSLVAICGTKIPQTIAAKWFLFNLVDTTLQICFNLRQMVAFLQGDRNFSISGASQSIVTVEATGN